MAESVGIDTQKFKKKDYKSDNSRELKNNISLRETEWNKVKCQQLLLTESYIQGALGMNTALY